jgi:predicted lysophospholipase L1 biosynthesis ABC-type transport system permease subunit
MHGPSAIPLLVELAATAIVLIAAFARKPLARAARVATTRLAPRRRRLRAATD